MHQMMMDDGMDFGMMGVCPHPAHPKLSHMHHSCLKCHLGLAQDMRGMGSQGAFLAGGMDGMMGRGMVDMGGNIGGPPPLPGPPGRPPPRPPAGPPPGPPGSLMNPMMRPMGPGKCCCSLGCWNCAGLGYTGVLLQVLLDHMHPCRRVAVM